MGGGALELEDLAGVVGAVGLLATLADEFVGGANGSGGSAGNSLRGCLSGMAREFFQGANKVRWEGRVGWKLEAGKFLGGGRGARRRVCLGKYQSSFWCC